MTGYVYKTSTPETGAKFTVSCVRNWPSREDNAECIIQPFIWNFKPKCVGITNLNLNEICFWIHSFDWVPSSELFLKMWSKNYNKCLSYNICTLPMSCQALWLIFGFLMAKQTIVQWIQQKNGTKMGQGKMGQNEINVIEQHATEWNWTE